MQSARFEGANILITGGTGLIGQALSASLHKAGAKLIVLTRNAQSAKAASDLPDGAVRFIQQLDDIADDEQVSFVVNLAGASISDRRWSDTYKKELFESRINTTDKILELIKRMKHKPTSMLNASAVGFYGDWGDALVDESTPGKNCFSHALCHEWEQHARQVEQYGVALSIARFGVVFSRNGGAWLEFKKPLLLKASPIFGSGRQFLSWVHIDDVVSAALTLLGSSEAKVANIVSPEPITYNEMSKILADKAGCFMRPRLPASIIKIVFGQMGEELFLASTRAMPAALSKMDFHFKFSDFGAAVDHLMQK